MNLKLVIKSAKAIQMLGMICTVLTMLMAACGINLVALVLMLWAVLPYCVFYNQIAFMTRGPGPCHSLVAMSLLAASVILSATAFYYPIAVLLHPDPQSGLAFVFIPLWQLGLAITLAIICLMITKFTPKSGCGGRLGSGAKNPE